MGISAACQPRGFGGLGNPVTAREGRGSRSHPAADPFSSPLALLSTGEHASQPAASGLSTSCPPSRPDTTSLSTPSTGCPPSPQTQPASIYHVVGGHPHAARGRGGRGADSAAGGVGTFLGKTRVFSSEQTTCTTVRLRQGTVCIGRVLPVGISCTSTCRLQGRRTFHSS